MPKNEDDYALVRLYMWEEVGWGKNAKQTHACVCVRLAMQTKHARV